MGEWGMNHEGDRTGLSGIDGWGMNHGGDRTGLSGIDGWVGHEPWRR